MAGEAKEGEAEAKLNPLGEISLPLDGQQYQLRPSRKAISNIEQQLRSLPQLAADARSGMLSIEEMGLIAAELMRAFGEANPEDPLVRDYKGAKPDVLADLIYEAGAPAINSRLMLVLIGALTGGYTASGEAKPTTRTTTA